MTSIIENRRLKYAVEGCFNGVWGDEANGVEDMVVVRVADFDREKAVVALGDNPTVRAIPENARNRRVLERGDLLMEKSGGGDQKPVGNVVLFDAERQAVCSNFVARLPVARNCESRYLAYVFRAMYSEARNIPHIKQTSGIQNLDSESYLNERAWLPERNVQQTIANFLDEKTARIDALIAEKEQLAGLLKDVVWDDVTRAVTVGIDAATTKPTKLDWCPNVPNHWDVLLLKRLFERTEYGISESMNPEGQVAVLRMGNISDGRVLMSDLKYVDSVDSSLVLSPGDVLYNRTNSLAQVGKVGLVRELPDTPVTFASYLVRLVPNKKVLPEYLVYLLNCPDVLAIARSLALPAIGQANLNPTRYGYIHVPCPPIDEQRRIVAHLDKKTAAVSTLADHVQEHIDRLREYRSSLISAAVTGQLDIGAVKEAE